MSAPELHGVTDRRGRPLRAGSLCREVGGPHPGREWRVRDFDLDPEGYGWTREEGGAIGVLSAASADQSEREVVEHFGVEARGEEPCCWELELVGDDNEEER